MAELDEILASLRRHRKDLDDLLESTSSRSSDAAALVRKIEELRARAEKTQREFQSQKQEAPAGKKKTPRD